MRSVSDNGCRDSYWSGWIPDEIAVRMKTGYVTNKVIGVDGGMLCRDG